MGAGVAGRVSRRRAPRRASKRVGGVPIPPPPATTATPSHYISTAFTARRGPLIAARRCRPLRPARCLHSVLRRSVHPRARKRGRQKHQRQHPRHAPDTSARRSRPHRLPKAAYHKRLTIVPASPLKGRVRTHLRLSILAMFNAPRPQQPYGASSSNGFGVNSFMSENPLANSMYDDGLDPWSAAPSPAPPPVPSYTTSSSSGLGSVIGKSLSMLCEHAS